MTLQLATPSLNVMLPSKWLDEQMEHVAFYMAHERWFNQTKESTAGAP